MKNNILVSILVIFFVSFIQGQTVVPDDNFEAYLETHDVNGNEVLISNPNNLGDGILNNNVPTNKILNVVNLNVSNKGILTLTGIEYFSNLESLICYGNNLTELIVSANINLKTLLCGLNQLESLDITSNTGLEVLDASGNQISKLNVLSNTLLERLIYSDNRLDDLDVSKNNNLKFLAVSNNQLNDLVVSSNTNLENLFCASNLISTLNLSANKLLKNLDARNNVLTNLDLTTINSETCPDPQTNPLIACQGSTSINVSNNQLESLIISNGFNYLVSSFNSEDNPDLACILVDDPFTVITNETGVYDNWFKDDWTYYSDTTCTDIYTYVPDENFETYLETNNFGDGVLDNNLVLTDNISNLTDLPISTNSISDLTGIEDFLALTSLDCSDNDLTSLDLSANVNLTSLNCSNNILPTINLEKNTALINLECSSQSPFVDTEDATNNYTFNRLNINTNIALETIDCSNNDLINLDLSTNVLLTSVDCSSNQITSLNVVLNDKLATLICNSNALSNLNVKNGTNAGTLTSLNTENNPELFCIEVDDVAFSQGNANWLEDDINYYNVSCGTYVPDNEFESYLESIGLGDLIDNNNFVSTALVNAFVGPLDISNRSISDLTGVQDFLVLQNLNCSTNALTHLDLSNNTALTAINCSFNQIEHLRLVSNIALQTLRCNDNALQSLDVRNGANNPLLTNFDASNNPSLFCINVDDVTYSKNEAGWQEDDDNYYNTDCDNSRFTSIPDANFEQALIDLGYDDVIDTFVLTSKIEHILSLNVSDKSIEELIGILGFKSLKELDCSGNNLSLLDVNDMVNLEKLNCNSNYLLTNDVNDPNGLLNIEGTSSLIELFCASNDLSYLDTSLNQKLELLNCADNSLSVLNVTGNSPLRVLNCSNNNLTALNISTNDALEEVNCNSNLISNFITTSTINTTLTMLSCANNDLPTLLVDFYQVLTNLNCRSNLLTELNTASNPALENLDFTSNQITDINLLSNSNLISVLASQNELSQLNFALNTPLEILNCDNNKITQLTVNTIPFIKHLFSVNNQLTNLDLSSNGDLVELNINSNLISNLLLSNNLNTLKTFNCNNNELSGGLDLSTMGSASCPTQFDPNDFCPDFISINVSNNQLDFINIQNGINGQISSFNATNNSDLDCIQVDDVNNIGVNWLKDFIATYSQDCRFGETYVPDEAFEQALRDLGYDANTTDPLDNYVPTALIEGLLNLDVSGKGISDLTGIEDFTALQDLNCSNNALNVIDLKKNLNLAEIDCSNNTFSDLDFSSNSELITIDCSTNALSSLALSATSNLTNLNIANNSFSTFLPNAIPSLEDFNCDSNQLTDLDLSANSGLTALSCESNSLQTLNIKNGQNPSLSNLNAQGNLNLTCIVTDSGNAPGGVTWLKDATAEYEIDCHYGETYVPEDGFELALITKGLDSGGLDNYVLTANIDNISNLDISNNTIVDLTGLEDFIGLKKLNFSDNNVMNVDLSKNVLLEELDASNNVLTEIDLSFNPNLEVLNISTNSLSEVDLNANTNLLELNVSGNQLTVLNVDALVILQWLDCSLNQLNGLDASLNVNLKQLYCQSNLFIQDKLNLKNGANQDLTNFNATNNPDLACILVDDSFTVITNETGVYDNWFKDVTSNYQTVCEDADNDGIANADDQCPGTPFGDAVDLFGCSLFSLANNNFTVLITGETCLNNNDGKINITTLEYYNYTATLIKDNFNKEYHFTNEIDILNLLAGSYQMCITIEEKPDFEICYDVVISQPEPLGVLTNKSLDGKSVSINMYGSSSYNIDFNGLKFNTSKSSLTLSLQEGENHVKVSTDVECQGVYEETILVSDDVFAYPNPFHEKINLYTGNSDSISVKVYSYLGQLVYSNNFIGLKSNKAEVDTSSFSEGIYVITVETESLFSTFKMVKK